jgi:hypothetical protein
MKVAATGSDKMWVDDTLERCREREREKFIDNQEVTEGR